MTTGPELPDIALESWEPTRQTLHLWCQIVGKVKLATTSPRNHWWNIPLFVDVRGLTTHRLTSDGTNFRVDFDFLDHRLRVLDDRGDERSFALRDGISVAEFDRRLHGCLGKLGLDVEIKEEPFRAPFSDIAFADDTTNASYDPAAVQRYWRALEWVDRTFEEFSGWFCGKQSPVQMFWHSFDLAVTRFSGRLNETVADADAVTREAYSHEVISFGFWPGDSTTRFPAFYSYTAPEPEGLSDQPLKPAKAFWQEVPNGHLALLPYETVRRSGDARVTLLAFLESAYQAGAVAAEWDRSDLTSSFCPTPEELEGLFLR